jgi:hypothetical protein
MSFKSSLTVGGIGETLFYTAHNGVLKRTDGRKSDLINVQTGEQIELKSDGWAMDKTPNFFFEIYSDKRVGSPGGPWRSKRDGIDTFVYFYVMDLTFFTFDTCELVDRIEELKPSLKTKEVRNASWVTEGYLVPRDMLKDIFTVSKISTKLEPSCPDCKPTLLCMPCGIRLVGTSD